MPIETYYTSKSKQGKFGDMFFLKQLQEADSGGGGLNLLGSMVQWIGSILQPDYVIPQCMSGPRAIITELEKRKEALGISGTATLEIKLGSSTETVKIEKNASFDAGIGPFPAIPFNLGVDVDFAKMKSVTMKFGEGTYSEYIPMGYLAALYAAVKGKPPVMLGGDLLKKNAFISQILLAKKYSVTFESIENFTAGVDAKLKAYNDLPQVGGNVKLARKTERSLVAEVDSPIYYLIALTATRWDKLK